MKDIRIRDIVELRRKSEKGRNGFIAKLNKERKKGEGGDYWISCVSSVIHFFEEKNKQYLLDKRVELLMKYDKSSTSITKEMYRKNIDILQKSESLDTSRWYPSNKIHILKGKTIEKKLDINGVSLKIEPSCIFSFYENEENKIGAIWFLAKKDGFQKEELCMFVEAIFRLLKFYYSERYTVCPEYCIAVDLFKSKDLNYSELQKGEVKPVLDLAVNHLKELLRNNKIF